MERRVRKSNTELCLFRCKIYIKKSTIGKNSGGRGGEGGGGEDSISSTTIGYDELKVRIVWTISCLIAASARHFLIQKTLNDQEKLEKLRIVDESNQGTLTMNSEHIQEFQKSMNDEEMLLSSSSWWSDGRTKLPALRMKMWYAPELKLTESSSAVMKGATLVVIRPAFVDNDEGKSNRKKEEESQDWLAKAFDGDREEGKHFVDGKPATKLFFTLFPVLPFLFFKFFFKKLIFLMENRQRDYPLQVKNSLRIGFGQN